MRSLQHSCSAPQTSRDSLLAFSRDLADNLQLNTEAAKCLSPESQGSARSSSSPVGLLRLHASGGISMRYLQDETGTTIA